MSMPKDALIQLVKDVDEAATTKTLSSLYERCGILLPYLKKLDPENLPGDLAAGFAKVIYTVEKWSKDVRGANVDIWPQLSDTLKKSIELLYGNDSSTMDSDQVVKKFWSSKRYSILNNNLGHGAFGRTLLIRDEDIGLVQVAKVYEPKNIKDENLKLRFFQFFKDEIKILHGLNQRNIVRVYAAHLYPSSHQGIILMEYVGGRTLDKYIEEYDTNIDDINDVFLQIISAFTYLESKNVVHRDIRPSNVMIDNDGVVKVIDFGCGKWSSPSGTCSDSLASVVNHDDAKVLPEESFDKEYTSQTDLFYIGEMFDRIIPGSECESQFRYMEQVKKMASTSRLCRYKSFAELKNTLDNTPAFVGVPSDEEKTIYTNFADSLMNAVANRCSDSTIALSEENVLSGLDSIVEENYYAEWIQNVPNLISIFISGNYRYHTKAKISTEVVRDFRQWFGRVPSRTKDVILKSLRARLKMVAIFDPIEDSMPF